jgi:hypothetical protein
MGEKLSANILIKLVLSVKASLNLFPQKSLSILTILVYATAFNIKVFKRP